MKLIISVLTAVSLFTTAFGVAVEPKLVSRTPGVCDDNTAIVALYPGPTGFVNYAFDQCIPYRVDQAEIIKAEACTNVVCYNHQSTDCSGGSLPPVGVFAPKGFVVADADQIAHLIGESATCTVAPI